jgi:hypothetical protein
VEEPAVQDRVERVGRGGHEPVQGERVALDEPGGQVAILGLAARSIDGCVGALSMPTASRPMPAAISVCSPVPQATSSTRPVHPSVTRFA